MALTNRDVTTGEARLSYVHLFTPYKRDLRDPQENAKYSTTVLIPKTDTKTKAALDAAINAAAQFGASKAFGGSIPPVLANPLHDGDGVRPTDGMPYGPECKGHWVFTASTKNRPDVIGLDRQPILNESEIYSGVYAYVAVSFFPYNNKGRKGVGCSLNAVMKSRDGEPLGYKITAEEAFAGIAAAPAINPITGLPMNA